MNAELTPAAVVLLALLGALLVHDATARGAKRRLLVLQAAVFGVGAVLIVVPEIARRLAHAVGIGRGVDCVLYPLVIWLVRESLVARRRRREDDQRIATLTRALAVHGAVELTAESGNPRHASPPGR